VGAAYTVACANHDGIFSKHEKTPNHFPSLGFFEDS